MGEQSKRTGRLKGGSFPEATDRLLPLFDDPDGRRGRRWRDTFDGKRAARVTEALSVILSKH